MAGTPTRSPPSQHGSRSRWHICGPRQNNPVGPVFIALPSRLSARGVVLFLPGVQASDAASPRLGRNDAKEASPRRRRKLRRSRDAAGAGAGATNAQRIELSAGRGQLRIPTPIPFLSSPLGSPHTVTPRMGLLGLCLGEQAWSRRHDTRQSWLELWGVRARAARPTGPLKSISHLARRVVVPRSCPAISAS